MSETRTYRKHNSFVELRGKKEAVDVGRRIADCRDGLSSRELPGEFAEVVQKACDDLLASIDEPRDGPKLSLHPNVVEEIDRLEDPELPRYLFYRYRYEVYPQIRRLDDFPPCLQVEPTSICNYRCVFCYQTDGGFTEKKAGHMGSMSFDLFREIIDQAEGRCEALTLASRGEPLICPEIDQMLEYTRGKFLALKINTNAWFLDERHCHAILQADPGTVVFSADAASEPAYGQYRVGGNLDRVLRNVRMFQEIRRRHYPHSRTISRVSGVQVPGTPDLDEMDRFWGDLVDQVAFVNYNPWENTYERPINAIEAPCSDLWRRMFVWWDGRVNPCDVDYRSMLTVGRLPEQSLEEFWASDHYQSLRQSHVSGERGKQAVCQRCTVV